MLRKRVPSELVSLSESSENRQLELNFGEIPAKTRIYEYAVLVASLPDEIITVAQHYRDRADSENKESMGLGWLYNPRSETLPIDGAYCSLGL